MTSTSAQINIRLPARLQSATEQYVENYGYRNIQEFILEAIRGKIFRDNKYDETFSEKEIDLISSNPFGFKRIHSKTIHTVFRVWLNIRNNEMRLIYAVLPLTSFWYAC